jgi:hypothetical protein
LIYLVNTGAPITGLLISCQMRLPIWENKGSGKQTQCDQACRVTAITSIQLWSRENLGQTFVDCLFGFTLPIAGDDQANRAEPTLPSRIEK